MRRALCCVELKVQSARVFRIKSAKVQKFFLVSVVSPDQGYGHGDVRTLGSARTNLPGKNLNFHKLWRLVNGGGMSGTLEPFTILGLAFTETRSVAIGAVVRAWQTVTVEYTCRLGGPEGHVLDASAGKPLMVRAGRGAVVPGWDIALLGMCAGEQAQLELPPSLAYGAKGNANTPRCRRALGCILSLTALGSR